MNQRHIAVVGTGYWGKNLVRNFHALGVMRTVCDSDPEVLRKIVEQHKGVQTAARVNRKILFLGLTAIVWGLELAVAVFVAAAFDLAIPLGNLLFVLVAIAVGTLVPAAPGYVGTFEFFGISALAMVGVTGAAALSFVVALHAIAILGSGLLGAICLTGWSQNPLAGKTQLRESNK